MELGTKNGEAFDLWLSLLKDGIYLLATTGTDRHRIREYKPERHVKTYVYIDELKRENILAAIRKGNSFLTSGPSADIKINEKSYGETVYHNGEVTIDISVESDKEIDKMYIYSDAKGPEEIDINSKKYNKIMNYNAGGSKWMFFVVGTDTFNKAITNPIFLKKIKFNG